MPFLEQMEAVVLLVFTAVTVRLRMCNIHGYVVLKDCPVWHKGWKT